MRASRTDRAAWLIATFFFVGLVPAAPGTMGTLAAFGPAVLVSKLPGLLYPAALAAFFLLSVWAAGRAEAFFGRKDAPEVVVDEVAGFLVTMLYIPATPLNLFIGFALFRLFDIAKPFPVRRAEVLPGGWGVVLDDILAGVYSNIILRIVVHYL